VEVVGDRPRLEAPLEEMPDAAMARVEAGRVDPVQAFHALGERGLAALDDQVEVVAHQAVRVQLPAPAIGDAPQEVDEQPTVVVVNEDRAPVDAA